MKRLVWPAVTMAAFVVGLLVGMGQGPGRKPIPGSADQARNSKLSPRQATPLQDLMASREWEAGLFVPKSVSQESPRKNTSAGKTLRASKERQVGATQTAGDAVPVGGLASLPSEEDALAQVYQYLRETEGMGWQERRQRAGALVEALREMGEPAVDALLQILSEGVDSRERVAAARLLGALQDARALPALEEVLETEKDVLLRRAAARGLSRLQISESIPIMENLLGNHQEDRFVRMSAAYGLAMLGQPGGIQGLTRIFYESTEDGRGRYLAFRALTSLNDARALPMMRQLAVSEPELSYRLAAIRFLADQGDQEAIPVLQQVLASPEEQPSILHAAAQAVERLSGEN